jgi:hypothetical protein
METIALKFKFLQRVLSTLKWIKIEVDCDLVKD